MGTLRPSDLTIGDVVLVDCLVQKLYHDDGWLVSFELVTMSVLERVSP